MVCVIIATTLAIFYTNQWTLIIGLSAAAGIFSNFLVHAYYTPRTGRHSPGVVTTGSIYVPVSLFIFYNFWTSGILSTLSIILAIIIGFSIMYVPTIIQEKRLGKIYGKNIRIDNLTNNFLDFCVLRLLFKSISWMSFFYYS